MAENVLVERVLAVDDDLVEAAARLVPQLSSTARPPGRDALEEIVSSPACSLFVARLSSATGAIVGMITLVAYPIPTGVHAVIEDVVVDESARGRGVGAALVSAVVPVAVRAGARRLDLTSRASREAANRLYLRAGFKVRDTNVYRLELS